MIQHAQKLMSENEARTYLATIKRTIETSIDLIEHFKLGQGWKALGYRTWAECVEKELGRSVSSFYRTIRAGELRLIIDPDGNLGRIPERHVRALSKLGDDREAIRYAYQSALAVAPVDGKTGEKKLTGKLIELTVNTMLEARATGGYVEPVPGVQTPIGAALTQQMAAQAAEARQQLMDKNPPLLNDVFATVEDAARAVGALHAQNVRVVVYPIRPAVRAD